MVGAEQNLCNTAIFLGIIPCQRKMTRTKQLAGLECLFKWRNRGFMLLLTQLSARCFLQNLVFSKRYFLKQLSRVKFPPAIVQKKFGVLTICCTKTVSDDLRIRFAFKFFDQSLNFKSDFCLEVQSSMAIREMRFKSQF